MLARELGRKTDQQLGEAFRFWGAGKREQLELRFRDRFGFLAGCARLAPGERALLLQLLLRRGSMTRHEVDTLLAASSPRRREHGPDEQVVEKLASRMLVYLRRDRAQLTDRNDRVYLFPEAGEQLKDVPLMEKTEFRSLLDGRINPPGALVRCKPELRGVLLHGGFLELNRAAEHGAPYAEDDIRRLYEQDLLEPVLVHDGCNVQPVIALAPGALCCDERIGETGFPAAKQSMYLYHLTMLADCLSFRNLERKNQARNTELCLRRIPDHEAGRRYIRDLECMGVVLRNQDRLDLRAQFLSEPYEQKLSLVEELLSDRERHIRCFMKKLGVSTREAFLSLLARERALGMLFDHEIRGAGDDRRSVEDLLFRGFLVQDHTGDVLLYNQLHPTPPARGAVIVNNDLEILVYPERISFFTLYVLACFCRVVGEEQAIRLRIDRDSVTRGMAVMGTAQNFLETLAASSKNPLDESVAGRIRQWADRCTEVRLRRRLVLELPTHDALARFFRNSYLRSHVEESADGLVVLSPRVDLYRLKRELRRENILAEPE